MIVDPTSFSTPSYKNNGTGWQPGDGKSAEFDTFNAGVGSRTGVIYPNNDFSRAYIQQPLPLPPSVWDKYIKTPSKANRTIFDDGNRLWSAADPGPAWRFSDDEQFQPVSVGTQFEQRLQVLSTEVAAGTRTLTFTDRWDVARQGTAAGSKVTVYAPDGTTLAPNLYRVEWTTDPDAQTGWVTQYVTARADYAALRVTFVDTIPTGTEPGAGLYEVGFPATVNPDLQPVDAGPVTDWMIGQEDGGPEVPRLATQILSFPATPTLAINYTTNSTIYNQGESASFAASPYVTNPVRLDNGLPATVTIVADRCLLNPVNTSTSAWTMAVTPGVPGPSGNICGDPASTPATLTFTSASGVNQNQFTYNSSTGRYDLPAATWTGTVSKVAGALTTAATVHLSDPAGVVDATAAVNATVNVVSTSYAGVEAPIKKKEVQEPLLWNVTLRTDTGDATGGGPVETVINLPGVDEDAAWARVSDTTQYPSTWPQRSNFHGTYTLASATIDGENSSLGTALYCTTDSAPSLTSTWVAYDSTACANATGLKVVSNPPDGIVVTNLAITLNPTSNLVGDAYVLWASKTTTPAGDAAPSPWPDYIKVVDSSIAGIVWRDTDNGADLDPTETRVAGATITLFRVNADGSKTALATQVTNSVGGYKFDGLTHGTYITEVANRGPNLPGSVTSHYGQDIPVVTTWSYNGKTYKTSRETSENIQLGVDHDLTGVNYGYFQAAPLLDVNKNTTKTNCNDSTCDIEYTIEVRNPGNTTLDGIQLTDTITDNTYDVQAMFGKNGVEIVDIVARDAYGGYGLASNGQVWCWGFRGSGSCGDGDSGSNPNPYAHAVMTSSGPLSGIVKIAARSFTTGFALDANGQLWSWGSSPHNGSGTGGFNYVASPVMTASGPLTGVKDFVVTTSSVYALDSNGQVWSWGTGSTGFLGNGTINTVATFAVLVQTATGPLTGITKIEHRGTGGAFALDGNGQVWAWGIGVNGANGNGGTSDNLVAAQVRTASGPLTGITDIQARYMQGGLALDAVGQVWSWGYGYLGANGNGSDSDNFVAGLVQTASGPLTGIATIRDRSYFGSFAVDTLGHVWSWGSGRNEGDNGNGNSGPAGNNYVAAQVVTASGPLSGIRELHESTSGASALDTNGNVWAWGSGTVGANGNGTGTSNYSAAPVLTASGPLSGITELGYRYGSAYAFDSVGRIWTWGFGAAFANGDGSTAANLVAAPVLTSSGDLTGVTKATDRGGSGAYAIDPTGHVWAWGPANSHANASGTDSGYNQVAGEVLAGPAKPLWGYGYESPTTPQAPVSTTRSGGFVERTYALPKLAPGASHNLIVTAKVNRADVDTLVLNQAWATSPQTPRTAPTAPADPGAAYDPVGVFGNASCSVNWGLDACDQVPVKITTAAVPPGALSGTVWVDPDKDGVMSASETRRIADVAVTLFKGGVLAGETVTDANGFYQFLNLAPGDDYTVTFSVKGLTDPDTAGAAFAVTTMTTGCVIDTSCADPATASTEAVTVVSGGVRPNVNAGLFATTTGMTVVKTSTAGEPALLGAGVSQVPVTATITNTGVETLTGFEWSDTTISGPTVDWIDCDLSTLTLATGASHTCTGTLTLPEGQAHEDKFTVTATGADTSTTVTADDPWSASRQVDPLVSKFWDGNTKTFQLLVSNLSDTGTVPGATYTDVMFDNAGIPMAPVTITNPSLGSITGNTWTIPDLAPGQQAVATLAYDMAGLGDGEHVTNRFGLTDECTDATLAPGETGPLCAEAVVDGESYTVTIAKMDESGVSLTGATFTLEGSNGTAYMLTGNAALTEFVTGDIPVGTYTLTEVKAPTGHNLLATPVTFTLDASGITIIDGASTNVVIDPNNTFKLVITDTIQGSLPWTGGTGANLAWLLGLILAGGAFVVAIRRRSRQD